VGIGSKKTVQAPRFPAFLPVRNAERGVGIFADGEGFSGRFLMGVFLGVVFFSMSVVGIQFFPKFLSSFKKYVACCI
jgi:hypothetical protein